ncbi:hypothetical protein RhiirB3_425051 [Rhizophagus irregularis]|nr:hypothetical protein RhiirB3_425051 [Rhizophagus irregularis]
MHKFVVKSRRRSKRSIADEINNSLRDEHIPKCSLVLEWVLQKGHVKRTNNNLHHSNIQTSNSFYPSTTMSSSFIAMPFPVYYPGMFNQQNSQPYQLTYASNNFSQTSQNNVVISVPSIDEFFGNLEKKFGENTFEGVKDKFIQETIDVLDIFDLKETDWQDLEIKIGLKTKIIREAEKYRR